MKRLLSLLLVLLLLLPTTSLASSNSTLDILRLSVAYVYSQNPEDFDSLFYFKETEVDQTDEGVLFVLLPSKHSQYTYSRLGRDTSFDFISTLWTGLNNIKEMGESDTPFFILITYKGDLIIGTNGEYITDWEGDIYDYVTYDRVE